MLSLRKITYVWLFNKTYWFLLCGCIYYAVDGDVTSNFFVA